MPPFTHSTEAGSPWLQELYNIFAIFAPVREEAASMSEEEIDQAIKEAVDASRKRHA